MVLPIFILYPMGILFHRNNLWYLFQRIQFVLSVLPKTMCVFCFTEDNLCFCFTEDNLCFVLQLMLDFFAKVFCMQNTLMDKKEREERRNSITFNSGEESIRGSVRQQSNETSNNISFTRTRDKRHLEFKYDRVGVFELQTEDWRPSNNGCGSESDLSERVIPIPSHYSQLEVEVREIRKLLKRMSDKSAEKAHKEYLAREWKLVALVLDRLFFFLYLMAIVVSACTLFETSFFQT